MCNDQSARRTALKISYLSSEVKSDPNFCWVSVKFRTCSAQVENVTGTLLCIYITQAPQKQCRSHWKCSGCIRIQNFFYLKQN